ncbi:MAG: hypothetical protein MJK04_12690, partial [Psychrosphaera sp.]|nr:hypothetical protein [Psychrosphaera sp.]
NVSLRASHDASTEYGVRNITRYIHSNANWNSSSNFNQWAYVSDGVGRYDAWLRGVEIDTNVTVTSAQNDVTVDHQLSVALKKASLIVRNNHDVIQVGTKVGFSFKDIEGNWGNYKSLKTDATGIVSIYLPALTDERELYRWVIVPTSYYSEPRIGETIEFTISEQDSEYTGTGTVTIVEQRLVKVKGTITEGNGLLLQQFPLGVRTTQSTLFSNRWYQSATTNINGVYQAELRALHNEVTQYDIRNKSRSIDSDSVWNSVTGYNEWAKINDGQGLRDAWVRGARLNGTVAMPINQNEVTFNHQLPIKLIKASLTVRSDKGEIQASTLVTFYFKGIDGQWLALKSFTTDQFGIVSLYLTALTDQRESYRWVITPTSNNDEVRTGQTIDFVIGEQENEYFDTGVVTTVEKRYATITGNVTDGNGLLLQNLHLGIRTVQANLFDSNWAKIVSTDTSGGYRVVLRAVHEEVTHYGVRNKSQYIEHDSSWESSHRYDYWASINDGAGLFDAWLRDIKLDAHITVPAEQNEVVHHLQLPIALKKASLTVSSDKGDIQIGTSVQFHFRSIDDQWLHYKTYQTDALGEVSIYLGALSDQ